MSRLDTEGIEDIDINACSRKPWQAFRGTWSETQRNLVTIFRCGASSTDTRHTGGQGRDPLNLLKHCNLCGEEVFPSLRHSVTECSQYHTLRVELSCKLKVPISWWVELPRVSSKSGWITLQAHRCLDMRSSMQVAICTLAMQILEANSPKLAAVACPIGTPGSVCLDTASAAVASRQSL